LDIVCSSKLTVFHELRSRKTVCFLEWIMSADKYPSMFPRQMEAIVYTTVDFVIMLHLSVKLQLFTKIMISATDSYLSYITGVEDERTHNL